MPTLSLNQRDVFYGDHPAHPDSLTLLLVHGSASSHTVWPGAFYEIPNVRVMALDLPGHGRSAPPGRRTIAQYAAVVEAFIATLDLKNVVLAGHSMGGAIALTVAHRAAVTLRGLILMGASARMPVHDAVLGGAMNSLDDVAGFVAANGMGRAVVGMQDEVRHAVLATEPMTVFGDFMACNRFDLRPNLATIDVPTLIIAGELDRMTPLRFSESLAAGLPRANLVTLEGVGHYAMLESTAEVKDLIERFAGELSQAESNAAPPPSR